MANAALASRKDGRDAVVAARKGLAAWAAATPYNRGQVMYRMAEMMEGRRAELVQALRDLSGLSVARATREVDLAVDSLVHHAGWTDKLATVMGSVNAVARRSSPTPPPNPPGSSSRPRRPSTPCSASCRRSHPSWPAATRWSW